MNWLPSNFRILYSTRFSEDIEKKLDQFFLGRSLFCNNGSSNNFVALVTDMKKEEDRIKYTLIELIPNFFNNSSINEEDFYIKVNIIKSYIENTGTVSNILSIMEK